MFCSRSEVMGDVPNVLGQLLAAARQVAPALVGTAAITPEDNRLSRVANFGLVPQGPLMPAVSFR
jgi:hypothetical protein